MERAGIENILRPILQNLNVIGSRGPPRDWVFPAMLASVIILVLIFMLIIFWYEYAFKHTCPLCRQKHKSVQ